MKKMIKEKVMLAKKILDGQKYMASNLSLSI